ncbi:MAG TPA: hypothetical protein VEH27_05185 [Methylomirabilota bacterium]|nr:hypothetical protein [Methylomirabilota bacterium]
MGLPESSVTFQPTDVAELNRKLSTMRHNVNNQLALVIAALEVIRRKPEMAPRLLDSIGQQPDRILLEIRAFSEEFEKAFQISREQTFG